MEETLTYRLGKFEGPLDLLLSLIKKNKMKIEDIRISEICDQYFEYIAQAAELDMELAVEFLVMASDLMLIKSRMLLPREDPGEADPRAGLAEALARLQAAKRAAALLSERYAKYGGRMAKETDEISPDRSFVADQDPQKLYGLMRRMLAELRAADEKIATSAVTPLVARKIVSVEQKIHGILGHFGGGRSSSLAELLDDAASRPELVAIFIGVLELVRMKRLVITGGRDDFDGLEGIGTVFTVNPEFAEDPEAGLVLDDYASAEETPEENKKNGEKTGKSDENSDENSGGNKSEDPA